jgi:hypothetical protein
LPAQEADALRAVVRRLLAVPPREPSAGLPARVQAAVQAERAERAGPRLTRRLAESPFQPWWGAAAAASVAVLLGVASLFHGPACGTGAEDGLGWLAGQQEADGTWDPARHGGDPAYRPAVTALAALALARDPAARHAERVGRACDALAGLQTPGGTFGGAGRAESYNLAIVTYALAALDLPRPQVKAALGRAVAYTRAAQSAEGGWDYEPGSEGNAAVTAWQVRALACASERGVAQADVPLRKGLRWLRGVARADGSVAYHRGSDARSESLSALAAHTLMTSGKPFPGLPALGRRMAASLSAGPAGGADADCYRDYVKVLAFESAGEGGQAAAVRGGLIKRRQSGGPDQWQSVGGTPYAYALTALTL